MNKLTSKPRRDETTYNEDEYARLYGKPSGEFHIFHTLNLVEEQHRRNIPDVVMSAWHDSDRNIICARLFTPQQQIDLEFDQALSEKQKQIYDKISCDVYAFV
jgi:hypothetical protein